MSRLLRAWALLAALGACSRHAPPAAPAPVARAPEPEVRLAIPLAHAEQVESVALSPDGTLVATASGDGSVSLWSATSGAQLAHRAALGQVLEIDVAFSPDGRSVVVAGDPWVGDQPDLQLLDVDGLRLRQRLASPGTPTASAIARDHDTIVATGAEGWLSAWGGDGTLRWVREEAGADLLAVADGAGLVFTAGQGGTVARWALADGRPRGSFPGPPGARALHISADGAVVALVQDGDDGGSVLSTWDTATGNRLGSVPLGIDGRAALCGSGDHVAVIQDGGDDGDRLVVTGTDGRPVWQEVLDRGIATHLSFSRTGERLLVHFLSGWTRVYQAETGQRITDILSGAAATLSDDGRTLVVADRGYGWITDLDADRTQRLVAGGSGHQGGFFGLISGRSAGLQRPVFSSDGTHLYARTGPGLDSLLSWGLDSGLVRITRLSAGVPAPPEALPPEERLAPWMATLLDGTEQAHRPSEQGEHLAVVAADGQVRVWRQGQALPVLEAVPSGEPSAVGLAPDGSLVAVGLLGGLVGTSTLERLEGPGAVEVRDTATGEPIVVIDPTPGAALRVDPLPRAQALLGVHALGDDKVFRGRLWSLATGRALADLGAVSAVAHSPDQGTVAVGSPTGAVGLWAAATGQALAELPGTGGRVTGLAFSPDGRWLAVTTQDEATALWRLADRRPLARLLALFPPAAVRPTGWAVVDAEGRLDTDDLASLSRSHWIHRDEPLRAHSVDANARGRVVPGLLARLVAGSPLPAPPPFPGTEAARPTVQVAAVPPRAASGAVGAWVRVCGPARDLRLLRDDRVVGWLDGPLEADADGCRARVQDVPLPATYGTNPDSFALSAYAFSPEGVRSETARAETWNPRSGARPDRRVVQVHIGVDDYGERDLSDLAFAEADARRMAAALGASLPDSAARDVLVLSSSDGTATRQHLADVLAALTRRPSPLALAPTGPDDIVVVTFSGHGSTDEAGAFQLELADGPLPEAELSLWLREVEAASMALVIDACQAAAAVEGEGFVPGPLGSGGFGQLAYDKRMVVLAASQSDAVALESRELRHGLLTWALTEEGLDEGRADLDGDGRIALGEWLRYGEQRVPELAEALRRGEAPRGTQAVEPAEAGWRSTRLRPASDGRIAQQPRLFSFSTEAGALTLRWVDAPR